MQDFPHLFGVGLLHDLVLLFWPPPQVLLHLLQPDQAENAPSTAGVLQVARSLVSPMQDFPHLLGVGLLHDLVLVFWPLPQVLLHLLQPDQAENAPSTDGVIL